MDGSLRYRSVLEEVGTGDDYPILCGRGRLARDGSSKDRALLNPCTGQPFSTIMDGSGLQDAQPAIGGTANNQYVINFQVAGNTEGGSDYTLTVKGTPAAR